MTTPRETLNIQLFDKWSLGAPKTAKFVLPMRLLTKKTLTTREQRILDWHFLRMKGWGIALPALFLTSFKPVTTIFHRTPTPFIYHTCLLVLWLRG
jgi:hypothetical protein